MSLYFYLPNRPSYPGFKRKGVVSKLKAGTIPLVIQKEGNHWRKIFSIMAKICFELDQEHRAQSWQEYRDEILLTDSQAHLVFKTELVKDPQGIHIISGLDCFSKFGLDYANFSPITDESPIKKFNNIYQCPYFDYRQFPNILIDTFLNSLLSLH